jgi:hypothetical protein
MTTMMPDIIQALAFFEGTTSSWSYRRQSKWPSRDNMVETVPWERNIRPISMKIRAWDHFLICCDARWESLDLMIFVFFSSDVITDHEAEIFSPGRRSLLVIGDLNDIYHFVAKTSRTDVKIAWP